MALTRPRAAQIYDIDYKQATRVVTVSNITLTAGAPSSVDGVSLSLNDRILVTGQSTASQNGIYYVTTVGTGSNGTWARSLDTNSTGELLGGTIVMVTAGAVYADTQWKLTTDDPITIGSTALTFVQNYSANSITAGTSNVSVTSNANVTISSAGTPNVLTVSSTGVVVAGTASATGNITGNYFIGNGSQLTGIAPASTYSNSNVSSFLATFGSNTISTTGTITASQLVSTVATGTAPFVIGSTTKVTGLNVEQVDGFDASQSAVANTIVVRDAGGNINTTVLSASGNVTGGNIVTSGTLTNGNITITGANIISTGSTIYIDPNGTGGTDGNVIITGNLSVTGNATYINSNNITTNDLTINVANNAATAAAANGGGIGVGPANAEYISLTYNSTSNIWVASNGLNVQGILSASGNVTGGNISATNHTGTTASITGNIYTGNILTNGYYYANGVAFTGSGGGGGTPGGANTYIQFNDGGSFNGTAGLTFNKITNALTTTGKTTVTAVTPPTDDQMLITNSGQPTVTAGTSGLQIDYYGGAAAVEASSARINMSPGSTAGGTWNAIRIVPTTGATTGVAINGIKFDSVTALGGTDSAINAGTGWDNLIVANGVSIINGSGIVQSAAISGSYTGITAVGTLTSLSATGNITGGNLIAGSGTGGNITGANVINATTLSATGKLLAGTANITPASQGIGTGFNVTSGDITVFRGDASGAIYVGNSGATYIYYDGTSWSIAGGTGVAVASLTTAGTVSATGNITGGNIRTAGQVSVTGNVTAASIVGGVITGTSLSVTGNISTGTGNIAGGNATITTQVNSTSFSASGNIRTAGTVSATGAVTGASVVGGVMTGTSLSVSGAVTGASVVGGVMTGTSLSVTGNISTGTGNIAGGNATVTTQINTTSVSASGNIRTAGTVSATGAVTGASVVGGVMTGTSLSVSGAVTGASTVGGIITGSSASVTGAVTGASLVGTITTAAQTNITSVGTLGALSVTGNVTAGGYVGTVYTNNIVNTGANATGNIGSAALYFNTAFIKATSAQYADLAEMYSADDQYYPGTVVEFGGANEVTISNKSHSPAVAGIISTNPSYLMNSALECDYAVEVALTGRVPCQVVGTIRKGDRLVASNLPGVATVLDMTHYEPGCIIGKALEDYNSIATGIIEVAVGRY